MNPAFIALGGANIGLIGLASLDSPRRHVSSGQASYAGALRASYKPPTADQLAEMAKMSGQIARSLSELHGNAYGQARTYVDSVGSANLDAEGREHLRWLKTGVKSNFPKVGK